MGGLLYSVGVPLLISVAAGVYLFKSLGKFNYVDKEKQLAYEKWVQENGKRKAGIWGTMMVVFFLMALKNLLW